MARHLISLDTAVNTQQVLMFLHLPDNHRHVRFDDNGPKCHAELKVQDTRRRIYKETQNFSVITLSLIHI